MRCRVLSWNVWWRLGPWQARHPAILRVLAEEAPDVLALQESWATGDARQVDVLGEVCGLRHTAFSRNGRSDLWRTRIGARGDGVEFGVAVASRWPLLEVAEVVLPLGGGPEEGRTALGVVVDHPDGPLPVVTTHLTSHPTAGAVRRHQLDAVSYLAWRLRARADALGPTRLPLLVTGDFNAHPDSDPVRRFGGVLGEPVIPRFGFVDCWSYRHPDDPGHTWVTRNAHVVDWSPQARIDYIFIGVDDLGRRGLVDEVALVGDGGGDGVWPSDHLGVRLDLHPVPR